MTWEVLRTFGPNYKAIFIGDASMSPYEIAVPGGSVEHFNEETGAVWMKRLTDHFHRSVWLNPSRKNIECIRSIEMIGEVMEDRMFPLTLEGLDKAIAESSNPASLDPRTHYRADLAADCLAGRVEAGRFVAGDDHVVVRAPRRCDGRRRPARAGIANCFTANASRSLRRPSVGPGGRIKPMAMSAMWRPATSPPRRRAAAQP